MKKQFLNFYSKNKFLEYVARMRNGKTSLNDAWVLIYAVDENNKIKQDENQHKVIVESLSLEEFAKSQKWQIGGNVYKSGQALFKNIADYSEDYTVEVYEFSCMINYNTDWWIKEEVTVCELPIKFPNHSRFGFRSDNKFKKFVSPERLDDDLNYIIGNRPYEVYEIVVETDCN